VSPNVRQWVCQLCHQGKAPIDLELPFVLLIDPRKAYFAGNNFLAWRIITNTLIEHVHFQNDRGALSVFPPLLSSMARFRTQ